MVFPTIIVQKYKMCVISQDKDNSPEFGGIGIHFISFFMRSIFS